MSEDANWPTTFSDLRQQIEAKRKVTSTPKKPVEPKPSTSKSAKPSKKRKRYSERTDEERAEDNLERHKCTKLENAEDLAAFPHLPWKRSMPSDFPVDSPFEHSKLWQDIFHSEQCGREYADAHVHLREPRFMEYLSMQRARDMTEVGSTDLLVQNRTEAFGERCQKVRRRSESVPLLFV